MSEGWKCPACGGAHGPHVDTCPVKTAAPNVWPPDWWEWVTAPWQSNTPSGDPPGPIGILTDQYGRSRVVSSATGQDLGPAD